MALTSAMAQTLVAADGSLVVTLPAGFTAPELTALGVSATSESMTVSVDAAVAATLTTPFGTALVRALREGGLEGLASTARTLTAGSRASAD